MIDKTDKREKDKFRIIFKNNANAIFFIICILLDVIDKNNGI